MIIIDNCGIQDRRVLLQLLRGERRSIYGSGGGNGAEAGYATYCNVRTDLWRLCPLKR